MASSHKLFKQLVIKNAVSAAKELNQSLNLFITASTDQEYSSSIEKMTKAYLAHKSSFTFTKAKEFSFYLPFLKNMLLAVSEKTLKAQLSPLVTVIVSPFLKLILNDCISLSPKVQSIASSDMKALFSGIMEYFNYIKRIHEYANSCNWIAAQESQRNVQQLEQEEEKIARQAEKAKAEKLSKEIDTSEISQALFVSDQDEQPTQSVVDHCGAEEKLSHVIIDDGETQHIKKLFLLVVSRIKKVNPNAQIYLIGGGARAFIYPNIFLKDMSDLDFVTTASKKDILAAFSSDEIRSNKYAPFLFQVKIDDLIAVDIFQSDRLRIGLEEDAVQRDYTINALYIGINSENNMEIFDPTGRGLQDLRRGIVNSIINPKDLFERDPKCVLRAIYHAAKLKKPIQNTHNEYFVIAPEVKKQMELVGSIKEVDGCLDKIPHLKNFNAFLNKIFSQKSDARRSCIRHMLECDVFFQLYPELKFVFLAHNKSIDDLVSWISKLFDQAQWAYPLNSFYKEFSQYLGDNLLFQANRVYYPAPPMLPVPFDKLVAAPAARSKIKKTPENEQEDQIYDNSASVLKQDVEDHMKKLTRYYQVSQDIERECYDRTQYQLPDDAQDDLGEPLRNLMDVGLFSRKKSSGSEGSKYEYGSFKILARSK